MNSFLNIKELLSGLYRSERLLSEMFKKRKSADYKHEYALEIVENEEHRIQYLIDRAVIRQNDNLLEIDDLYLDFFEQVLGANEEINVSYINENLEKVRQHVDYLFNENNERRKFDYLRVIKTTLHKIGLITLRNVVDLKRNIDNTFKNEPNYKNKRAKLVNLDQKRKDIISLVAQTGKLIDEDEITFFKTATDAELSEIIVQLKMRLAKSTHNLIELERQVIAFLNQIQQQSNLIEKLRQIKYLKDQFTLESVTDIRSVLAQDKSVVFEPRPFYPLKLSLEFLQTDEDAFASILKIAQRMRAGVKMNRPLAGNISEEYLKTLVQEEIQINLEEVKNSFMAGSYNLFDFLLQYDFGRQVSFGERITIYCQLASQYEELFNITGRFEEKEGYEVAMIYPQ